MRKLLLVSSSTVHGTGYLDHCEAEIRALFAGRERVLFVPYALHDRDAYAVTVRGRFEKIGLQVDSIHDTTDPLAAIERAEGYFVGGGNTFRLLKTLQDLELIDPLRRKVTDGVPYMGSSAGTNITGPTIRTTNDMPIVFPRSFEALALVGFQINPHYIDADPGSTHMGETREQRLAEFHEENETPVVGIREGAMLQVAGGAITVMGGPGGRLFRRGESPVDLAEGTRIDEQIQG